MTGAGSPVLWAGCTVRFDNLHLACASRLGVPGRLEQVNAGVDAGLLNGRGPGAWTAPARPRPSQAVPTLFAAGFPAYSTSTLSRPSRSPFCGTRLSSGSSALVVQKGFPHRENFSLCGNFFGVGCRRRREDWRVPQNGDAAKRTFQLIDHPVGARN